MSSAVKKDLAQNSTKIKTPNSIHAIVVVLEFHIDVQLLRPPIFYLKRLPYIILTTTSQAQCVLGHNSLVELISLLCGIVLDC